MRPRRPTRLHRPLPLRLPPCACESGGRGRGGAFASRVPLAREYAELEVKEVDRPRRIVEELRVGRRGRNHALAVYDFLQGAGGVTRVELTTSSEPATAIDRLKQVGAAGWIRRRTKKALERLRLIFEEPSGEPLKRVTIAGYEPATAPRFGAHPGMDPARASQPKA